MPGFYMLPREVGTRFEDHVIGTYDFALVAWVGTRYEGTHGGFLTNKTTIAELLGCSMKTVQRTLARTSGLDLIRHDLRQGRTNFTISLGPSAVIDPATLDSARGGRVQSDFGQGVESNGSNPVGRSGFDRQPTLDSRARKSLGLYEEANAYVGEEHRAGAREDDLATLDPDVRRYVEKARATQSETTACPVADCDCGARSLGEHEASILALIVELFDAELLAEDAA